jgi:uncharacterized membrane protein
MMKKAIFWIIATVMLAVIFHLAAIIAAPYSIMGILAYKNKKAGAKVNTIYHLAPSSEKSRRVVRPSPDLIYSAISYDLSKTSLRISAPIPDTYWSLSIFAPDTENFYVINDKQVQSKKIELIITPKGHKPPSIENAIHVESPSEKGVVILRMLIQDEDRLGDLLKIQKQARCEGIE